MAGPGVFLASHLSPGLLPAGFQDGVVGIVRVLLRQQRDVKRPQQPRGPGKTERKSQSPLSAQFSPLLCHQHRFKSSSLSPPFIPAGLKRQESAVIIERNLNSEYQQPGGVTQLCPSEHCEGVSLRTEGRKCCNHRKEI